MPPDPEAVVVVWVVVSAAPIAESLRRNGDHGLHGRAAEIDPSPRPHVGDGLGFPGLLEWLPMLLHMCPAAGVLSSLESRPTGSSTVDGSRRALVVEASRNDRASLAAVRALHGAGWSVAVASADPRTLASRSRYCNDLYPTPVVEDDLDGFVDAVARAAEDFGAEVVLSGGGDAEAIGLARGRDRIGARIPVPSNEQMIRAIDKLELARTAERVSLGAPKTVEAGDAAIESVDGPTMVKARLHAPNLGGRGPSRLEAEVVSNPTEARELIEAMIADGGKPILQERILGDLMAYTCVRDHDGEIVAQLQQLSEYTWPPTQGPSSYSVTTAIDPALAAGCARLLEEFEWLGIAQLQFIRDADGRAYVIDLNGRAYGSLALAEAAGVNLIAAWAEVGSNRPPATQPLPTPGVGYQWGEGDFRRALRERRGGLVNDLGTTFFRSFGARNSIFRRDDPVPVLRSIRRFASRVRRRKP